MTVYLIIANPALVNCESHSVFTSTLDQSASQTGRKLPICIKPDLSISLKTGFKYPHYHNLSNPGCSYASED
jgi:hypothetical protein